MIRWFIYTSITMGTLDNNRDFYGIKESYTMTICYGTTHTTKRAANIAPLWHKRVAKHQMPKCFIAYVRSRDVRNITTSQTRLTLCQDRIRRSYQADQQQNKWNESQHHFPPNSFTLTLHIEVSERPPWIGFKPYPDFRIFTVSSTGIKIWTPSLAPS